MKLTLYHLKNLFISIKTSLSTFFGNEIIYIEYNYNDQWEVLDSVEKDEVVEVPVISSTEAIYFL